LQLPIAPGYERQQHQERKEDSDASNHSVLPAKEVTGAWMLQSLKAFSIDNRAAKLSSSVGAETWIKPSRVADAKSAKQPWFCMIAANICPRLAE